MNQPTVFKCKMCGCEGKQPALSHIIPRGFFRLNQSVKQERICSMNATGDGRQLPLGIYDPGILCKECESRLNNYDHHGVNTLARLQETECVHRIPSEELLLVRGANRRLLRGFLATLLWRMSVTTQKEFKQFTIGETYEARIASDVLNDGDFNYVDAVIAFWPDPIAWSAATPERFRFKGSGVNGFKIKLPKSLVLASLDQRPFPGETRLHTLENPKEWVSPSLRAADDRLPLAILKTMIACGNLSELRSIHDLHTQNFKAYKNANRKQLEAVKMSHGVIDRERL